MRIVFPENVLGFSFFSFDPMSFSLRPLSCQVYKDNTISTGATNSTTINKTMNPVYKNNSNSTKGSTKSCSGGRTEGRGHTKTGGHSEGRSWAEVVRGVSTVNSQSDSNTNTNALITNQDTSNLDPSNRSESHSGGRIPAARIRGGGPCCGCKTSGCTLSGGCGCRRRHQACTNCKCGDSCSNRKPKVSISSLLSKAKNNESM